MRLEGDELKAKAQHHPETAAAEREVEADVTLEPSASWALQEDFERIQQLHQQGMAKEEERVHL